MSTCQKCGHERPDEPGLPKATRLYITYVGRNLFAIDGLPGLFMQKKPQGEIETTTVRALGSAGKGMAAATFYRLPELEGRLLAAIQAAPKGVTP